MRVPEPHPPIRLTDRRLFVRHFQQCNRHEIVRRGRFVDRPARRTPPPGAGGGACALVDFSHPFRLELTRASGSKASYQMLSRGMSSPRELS